ncbi:TetR/AcrR family transcriptional regulator [Rhodococcus sp. BP-252]|uniref:TetR/AcrR family transcriptional regulator n=1 Tax=unclassified Rhodococcus (in: high G+C Gram-positive bacteria) TaxID=192944 RepID=UPI001C9ADE08|nr:MULTISPECIES: TetR/AcrR family transcriptional regulator [unclassified Rhodococcus (in: high G+C Gram-positive bacteria)]MBY6413139.1 TetR/AcrR family transcriptional regulator [Rhodococcus sp. BP-320]MBY6417698.1 TetR/AcrR family transcriptional regulator [Rhodococcus sp. BP-321]MBY6423278.1 TetR/AcrR family transcriptional regulator [Rhodococcus sp. BP-324]MBY6427881.1 TetR/AcrR family transcriptional regulator [Rhodococcus sp. BP-323]MBY6431880.1 TetR/AcrR family transcriptional regulato
MPYRRTESVQARLDAGREKLFASAVEVLSTQGYKGLSIASVAAAAGVSAGSVYTHFENKSDLVVAIFRDVCGREVQAVADAGARGTVVERVTAIVETFAGRAMKNRTMAYALLAEPVDAAVDAERLVFRRSFTDAIAGAITAGIAAGDVPEQNAQLAAAALVGAVGEVLVGPLSPDRPPGPDVVPDLVAFALRSLGVRP